MRKPGALALCIFFMAMLLPASTRANPADKFSSSDNLVCAGPDKAYSLNKTKGVCEADTAAIKALRPDDCKGPTVKIDGGSCVPDKVPTPECNDVAGGYVAKLSGTGAAMTCSYDRTLTSSSPGDYVGDCLQTHVAPSGTSIVPGERYLVTTQKTVGNDDRELTIIPGKLSWWLSCASQHVDDRKTKPKAETQKVLASQMEAVGATRFGYAYGFLTMPYKYFPSEKSFQANIPIGGYMGWRRGATGSGMTFAVAITLSSVKANTVDPDTLDASGKPTVTGTTDVAALSYAVGMMFDIWKSPGAKPVKAGAFFGRDTVNNDRTIDYRFNRKNWIAIQIGYAFSDN